MSRDDEADRQDDFLMPLEEARRWIPGSTAWLKDMATRGRPLRPVPRFQQMESELDLSAPVNPTLALPLRETISRHSTFAAAAAGDSHNRNTDSLFAFFSQNRGLPPKVEDKGYLTSTASQSSASLSSSLEDDEHL